MSATNPSCPSSKSALLQAEPIKQLMQNRNCASLDSMADKIDEAMLWVVFNFEFVASNERDLADIYAELRDARDFFRLLGKYLNDTDNA